MPFRTLGAGLAACLLVSGAVACAPAGGDAANLRRGNKSSGTGRDAGAGVRIELPADGTGKGSGEVDPGSACIADARAGEKVPIDLYFMVDKSGSMKCRPDETIIGSRCQEQTPPEQSRWHAVTTALNDFVSAPENAGIGVGMAFFPHMLEGAPLADPECVRNCSRNGEGCECVRECGCKEVRTSGSFCLCADGFSGAEMLCSAEDYQQPALEVAILPIASATLAAKLAEQDVTGGTPTAPSLAGAVHHAALWASDHPANRVAIVYVTDGEPFGCEPDNTVEIAADIAAAAFSDSPSIATYVIGIGPKLDNLNRIAEAGGTQKAYLLDGEVDAVKAFSAALTTIRNRSLTCEYAIPEDEGLDLAEVNVRVGVGDAEAKLVSQAQNGAQCATNDGWYYDDPTAPRAISLCPRTCDAILGAQGSKLEVLIGCKTITIAPK